MIKTLLLFFSFLIICWSPLTQIASGTSLTVLTDETKTQRFPNTAGSLREKSLQTSSLFCFLFDLRIKNFSLKLRLVLLRRSPRVAAAANHVSL